MSTTRYYFYRINFHQESYEFVNYNQCDTQTLTTIYYAGFLIIIPILCLRIIFEEITKFFSKSSLNMNTKPHDLCPTGTTSECQVGIIINISLTRNTYNIIFIFILYTTP